MAVVLLYISTNQATAWFKVEKEEIPETLAAWQPFMKKQHVFDVFAPPAYYGPLFEWLQRRWVYRTCFHSVSQERKDVEGELCAWIHLREWRNNTGWWIECWVFTHAKWWYDSTAKLEVFLQAIGTHVCLCLWEFVHFCWGTTEEQSSTVSKVVTFNCLHTYLEWVKNPQNWIISCWIRY